MFSRSEHGAQTGHHVACTKRLLVAAIAILPWGSSINIAHSADCQDLTAAINSAKAEFSAVITRQKHERSYATSLSLQGAPCTVFADRRGRRHLSCFQVSSDPDAARQLYSQFRTVVPQCLESTRYKDLGEKTTPAREMDGIAFSARVKSTWLVQIGDADDVKVVVSSAHSTDPDEDPYITSLDIEFDQ
jgi:hypothetical protein